MVPFDEHNIDQILEEFSSDELINLSDDLLRIAIELSLQEDLDISTVEFTKGNELLAVIPKVIASRLSKAEIFSREFADLKKEDLVFVGYSIAGLDDIRKLLEDVITLIERRTRDDLDALYHEVFEELGDSFNLDSTLYRKALANVNEAYRIQSRHVMTQAIDIYKQVNAYDFELFLREDVATLEKYRDHLDDAVELIATSDLGKKFSAQLHGLRKTLILVLEALNANTVGSGFLRKKISYIDDILYHIHYAPEEYIFEVINRFAKISPEGVLLDYMKPEEIAIRYRTRYIKHNRVLLSLISNPIKVKQDFLLEVVNNILKNLLTALNVKLQFIRTGKMCEQLIEAFSKKDSEKFRSYTQEELNEYYKQVGDVLTILETHTSRSDYLETLREECYQAAIVILEWFKDEFLLELAEILRRYQIYAARKLFTLRISTLCMVAASYTPQELTQLASGKILHVCRDLIQYQYDFLKPTSAYLESMFDLERYRVPVLNKIEETIQRIQTGQSSRTSLEQLAQDNSSPGEKRSKSLFSQMVIDGLALRVQELDDSPQAVQEAKSITKRELRIRINTSKERIEYFLKRYEEESQLFMEHYLEGLSEDNLEL